jgi:hypothetical protein
MALVRDLFGLASERTVPEQSAELAEVRELDRARRSRRR